MHIKSSLFLSLLLAIALMLGGCALSEGIHDENKDNPIPLNSMNNHAPALEDPGVALERLKERVMTLQGRIAVFNQEEYFNPHEFRLSSWEILKDRYEKEVNELREKIAHLENQMASSTRLVESV